MNSFLCYSKVPKSVFMNGGACNASIVLIRHIRPGPIYNFPMIDGQLPMAVEPIKVQ